MPELSQGVDTLKGHIATAETRATAAKTAAVQATLQTLQQQLDQLLGPTRQGEAAQARKQRLGGGTKKPGRRRVFSRILA